jgi:transposase
MWTQANRGRMADIEKKTKHYPTDLTNEEWERIAPFMPRPGKRGRRPGVGPREVLNAIRYIARAGCGCGCCPRTFHHGRRSLLASGQITMRRVDGWQSLNEKPSDQIIDLAA